MWGYSFGGNHGVAVRGVEHIEVGKEDERFILTTIVKIATD